MQYDLKYWPTVSDLLHGIADAADDGYAVSYDPIILACTRSRESSNLDFLRALLEDLRRAKKYDNLVSTFKCSDSELTAITNCALGLVEDAYSLGAIKKARQRIENENGDYSLNTL